MLRGKQEEWQGVIRFTLMFAFFGAVLSCIAGWIQANEGGYEERSLFIHRWGGIAIAIVTLLLWRWQRAKDNAKYRSLIYLGVLGGLTYIGPPRRRNDTWS